MQYSEFYFDYDLVPFVGYDVSDAVFQCVCFLILQMSNVLASYPYSIFFPYQILNCAPDQQIRIIGDDERSIW